MQTPRREVGRIGLEQQPVARDVAHELEQVRATPLVADPAGDADMKTEVQVAMKLGLLAGKAMGDAFLNFVGFQDFGEPGVRIPRVQEQRLLDLERQLNL